MDSTPPSILCPFTLTVEPMAAMLNFEIADDPTYAGFEVQRFDDPVHGAGVAVLLVRRHDRLVDVYRQPGLRLDAESYVINGGLGEWLEVDFASARVEVGPRGVDIDIDFRDLAGRRVEVRIDDRDEKRREPGALLAPVSAGIERPNAMLLVWMPRFDLVRTSGRQPEILIDGRAATTGRLPAGWLHRRRLIKVAADLVVVRLNPAQDGPLGSSSPGEASGVALAQAQGGSAIAAITVDAGGTETRLAFDPPVPDVERLPEAAPASGTWQLGIGSTSSVVSGTWEMLRRGHHVELSFDSTAEWRPGPLPLLMRIVTRVVPTFRRWPTTYRWRATFTLDGSRRLQSRWERKGSAGDASYRRLMRA